MRGRATETRKRDMPADIARYLFEITRQGVEGHSRCSQLAIIRRASTGISAFAHKRSNCLRPATVPAGLWSETLFRHPRKRMFTSYRWGPGKAECGASAEG